MKKIKNMLILSCLLSATSVAWAHNESTSNEPKEDLYGTELLLNVSQESGPDTQEKNHCLSLSSKAVQEEPLGNEQEKNKEPVQHTVTLADLDGLMDDMINSGAVDTDVSHLRPIPAWQNALMKLGDYPWVIEAITVFTSAYIRCKNYVSSCWS